MATIWNEQSREFYVSLDALQSTLKQLTSRFSKSKKIIKLTVNTGQVMFSGEIFYYDPLIQLTKSLVKQRFFA